MADELVVAQQVETDLPKRDDLFLVARNHMELQQCQTRMTVWFREQILLCKRNEHELREAVEVATRNKWQHSTLAKQLNLSIERKDFLVKCLRAVEAGYAIIPDMPTDVFAIRVSDRARPQYSEADTAHRLPSIRGSRLPEGEGKYTSNRPLAKRSSSGKFYSKALKPVVFPAMAAKARIMEATEQAMALKMFDQIEVAPRQHHPRDPMIIGRIFGPGHDLIFIICWFLDLESI